MRVPGEREPTADRSQTDEGSDEGRRKAVGACTTSGKVIRGSQVRLAASRVRSDVVIPLRDVIPLVIPASLKWICEVHPPTS